MRRRLKLLLLTLLRALGVFALARRWTGDRVRILCYHGVWHGSDHFAGDALFMSAKRFRRQLDLVVAGGYPVLPLDTVVERLADGGKLPTAPVAITIDDGWYSTYADMWPPLRRLGLPATLYVDTGSLLSGRPVPHVMAAYLIAEHAADPAKFQELLDATQPWAGSLEERHEAALAVADRLGLDREEFRRLRRFEYMTPAELTECRSEGLDVQLHTRSHVLTSRTAEEIGQEVRLNREDLCEILNEEPEAFRHFCYPSGVHDPAMHQGLRQAGVISATTTEIGLASASDELLALPRLIIGESHSDLEFQAELSGVMHILRRLRSALTPGPTPRLHRVDPAHEPT